MKRFLVAAVALVFVARSPGALYAADAAAPAAKDAAAKDTIAKDTAAREIVAEPPIEQRIAGRAAKVVEKAKISDPAVAATVKNTLARYYTELNAAHTDRDTKLAAVPAGKVGQLERVHFDGAKQVNAVFGKMVGSLAKVLDDKTIDAVEDAMTFDMVPLSHASYQTLFPAMNERQKAQLYAWLVDTREAAVAAGSAESKLDAFRVNKLRMHTYLAEQGFDVETVIRADEARKAAERDAKEAAKKEADKKPAQTNNEKK